MNATQFGLIVLVLALVLLPQALAAYFSAPPAQDTEEFDYR